ncbi:hypothetical protein ACP4OV_010249 [Aristida adscensionis]
MAEVVMPVTHAWIEWVIQALVPMSFTLQVTLLILAELRRRKDSGVLRFFAWSAYMMADAMAIYVLGHMSVTSRSPEHQLIALWAPVLLVHLGGQDNITAYAMEDNRLWLRHLQTLAAQVVAAAYVLYQSSILNGSRPLLCAASILIFVVGGLKYGERVWALKCAGSSPMGKNYRTFQAHGRRYECGYYLDKMICSNGPRDTEAYLLMAHRTLDVPRQLLQGLPNENGYPFASELRGKVLYKVVEMQLSLMHDVFYTKVEVMHRNLHSLCVRIISALATAAAFLVFHLQIKILCDHNRKQHSSDYYYSSLDVAITYLVLIGAVILETASLLAALFSSWTAPLLVRWSRDKHGMEDRTLCNCLGRMITSLRRLVHAADWRRRWSWSRSLGQHNLFQLCTRSRSSRSSRIARWIGVEDWWNTLAYSSSIPVPEFIEELLVDQVFRSFTGASEPWPDPNRLFDSVGTSELKRLGLYDKWGLHEDQLAWSLEEKILVWHIATDIYLTSAYKKQPKPKQEANKVEAVEALSNYMMFLLATRPDMLSPTASRSPYIEMCYGLTAGGLQYSSAEKLASILQDYGDAPVTESVTFLRRYGCRIDFTTQIHLKFTMKTASGLGAKLITKGQQDPADTLDLIAKVWVETLCYASRQCSAFSHARQLSNGGELITVAAFLVEYFTQNIFQLVRWPEQSRGLDDEWFQEHPEDPDFEEELQGDVKEAEEHEYDFGVEDKV